VYSFGIILWEMIAREVPFTGLNGVQVSIQVTTNGLRPQLPEDLDPDMGRLIQLCWDTNPENRPSFTDVVGELKRIKANMMLTNPDLR
jgi:serine/threonine protein kinase